MGVRFTACAACGAAVLVAAILGLAAPAYPHKPITTSIIFKNENAQIFQRKCFQCHTENNLGVPLTSYTDARPWARAIREEVLERRMPPWSAVRGYGRFSNDLSLSAREMEVILSWADGGAPSGVPKAEEPLPPVFVAPAPSWDRGEPDVAVPIGSGQAIAAGAPFEIKRFVVPTGFTAARRVRALALKQGDRRVVRHAAFYEETSGRWLGGWTPWQTAAELPKGVVHQLPAGARIVVEIGYSGAEEAVTDKSELGFYFDQGAASPTSSLALTATQVAVAPGSTGQRVRTETTLTSDIGALAFWPNPGRGARSVEITATTPDGLTTPLLWIKDYRGDWQSPYVMSNALTLARGTRLAMTSYYDNAGDQPVAARLQAWLLTAAPKR
jgi:hypothetical protein